MIKVQIQEHKTQRNIDERMVPQAHAEKMSLNGGFYKVTLINEFNIILGEYLNGVRT